MQLWQLKQRQGLSLEVKERLTEHRIREWYDYWIGEVYAIRGELDSKVLLHQIQKLYPNIIIINKDSKLLNPEVFESNTNRKPFIGRTLENKSEEEVKRYLELGCNCVVGDFPRSNPIGFWLKKDIRDYIKKYYLCDMCNGNC